jgi:hypothetical protein
MDDKRTGLAAVVRWPDVHPGAWNKAATWDRN